MAMATASDATAVTKSPTLASTTITTSAHPTTFSSLPREIRDKIYGLVLPHSQTMDFRSILPLPRSSRIPRMGNCRILATYASGSQFAQEACMMFFRSNVIRVSEEYLPEMLSEGPFAELASSYMYHWYPCGVPMIYFDVKTLIRRIIVVIDSEQEMNGLAERVGLLLVCPALREVEVFIWKYHSPLERIVDNVSNAFKPVEEETNCRLTIRVNSYPMNPFPPSKDTWCGEIVYSDLKGFEDAIRDEDSIL